MARKRRRVIRVARRVPPGDAVHISGQTSPAREAEPRHDTGPELTGGDVDADWQRAHISGEEAVGGSVQTPDQDVVDELARALGVEEDLRSPLHGVEEIMAERDRRRWELEEAAAAEEEGREAQRR